MLLFVSTKDERLANWTTVILEVFLPLSFLPSTFPFVQHLEAVCPQVEGEGLLLTRAVEDVKGGFDWHLGLCVSRGQGSCKKKSRLVAGKGPSPGSAVL